jgi:hypothetical protein
VNDSPVAAVLPQLAENGLVPETCTDTGEGAGGVMGLLYPPPQPASTPPRIAGTINADTRSQVGLIVNKRARFI